MSEQNQPGPASPPPPLPSSSQEGGTADAGGGLQFDRAEFANRPAKKCTACKGGIQDAYFTINGAVVCGDCCQTVQAQPAAGSGMQRFARATLFGAIAAALGAGVYYGVSALTGSQWSLIAILVGWMVGKAVSNGSRKRGGLVYQFLAVFLTYSAIVSSYLPDLFALMRKHSAQRPAAVAKSGDKAGDKKALPAKTVAESAAATDEAEEDDAADAESAPPGNLGAVGLVITTAVLVVVAFAIPFLAAFQSPLLLIVIGIGLYQAWAMNRRTVLDIKGPFPVASTVPAEVKPSGA